ncbi:hypothetical protein O181_128995 [Austropuccinia psidii MF-1]|uniref:Uncharacterized protein n=1 Tax=Austropuccinia psidii MF-1 TaxID=1389203 RepID=A0A9Q3Q9J7_9BASI|nr:hypothetical protein [Austropuccinia psidii MF-1]
MAGETGHGGKVKLPNGTAMVLLYGKRPMPGELKHAVKCRCNQNCILDDISNNLHDIRKRANIGKFTPYRSTSFKEKQPFRV